PRGLDSRAAGARRLDRHERTRGRHARVDRREGGAHHGGDADDRSRLSQPPAHRHAVAGRPDRAVRARRAPRAPAVRSDRQRRRQPLQHVPQPRPAARPDRIAQRARDRCRARPGFCPLPLLRRASRRQSRVHAIARRTQPRESGSTARTSRGRPEFDPGRRLGRLTMSSPGVTRTPPDLRLIVITDVALAAPHTVRDVVAAALDAGAPAIQLRDTDAPASTLLEEARELLTLVRRYGALLFINDRVDVALAAGADGVHLGPDDLPVSAARRIAPDLLI